MNQPAMPVLLDFQSANLNPPASSRWLFSLSTNSASAVTILIGDVDGFGIDPTGLYADNGSLADTNGNGIIEEGEYLPDWNRNESTAVNSSKIENG